MPLPWLTVPWTELQVHTKPVAVYQQPVQQEQRIDAEFVVRAESSVYDPLTQTFIFNRGVAATYDVTTIYADRLEVHMAEGEEWARATGNVRIEDPDADISAEDLEFTWKTGNRSGKAKNIMIRIGHAHLRAETAELTPELWTFENVQATNCPEYYWVRSPRVTVRPGQSGKIEDPTLYAFGRRIIGLPDRNFNLDPRTQGVGLPSISFRKGQGLGVSWEAGWLLNQRTNLYVSMGAFPKAYPSFTATATRSSVPVERANAIITPGSELGERFRFGYLENIEIRTPSQEERYLKTEKNSVSVSTVWNQGVSGRDFDTSISKAIEGVYEVGGLRGARTVTRVDDQGRQERVQEGGFGVLGQARIQAIRERGNPFTTRGILLGSVELPSIQLGRNLYTLSRVDTSQFLGRTQYGWLRGIAGVVYEPVPQVRLSGGLVGAVEHGNAQFPFDRLTARNGFHARVDFDFGPTKISYLQKYDTRLKFYDREYIISQVAGCFEPYVLYRQFPSDYRVGVRFRLDQVYDIISRREFTRSGTRRTTISSMSHP